MDEQNGDAEPGIWRAWAAPAHEPAEGPPADSGSPDASGTGEQERPETAEQPTAPTQPSGIPQSSYPAGDYGQPGYFGPGQPGGYGHGGGYGGGYGMPPGYGGPQPPRRRRGLTTVITYLAVAALAATAGGLVVSFADSGSTPPSASSGSGSGNNGGGNFGFPNSGGQGGVAISPATKQKVITAVEPGIVVINSNLDYSGVGAAGTGMIISKSGLVLTNNHVIDQTTGLSATVVTTGKKFPAKWLGYDKSSDVAVIQLQGASNLTTVPLGDSATVKVGDPVIAMGNAGGTGSITSVTGTITGVNQTITASDQGSGAPPERLTDMLQTDADIISGDSGGPLASTAGKVIGMDTAASANSYTTQQNIGFAIPINKAMTIARQIIAGKSGSGVQIGAAGFVGVLVAGGNNGAQSTLTSPQAQLQQQEATQGRNFGIFGSPVGCVQGNQDVGVPASIAPVSSGTLVLGVICGGPANRAGMVAGDVITKVAGQQVTSPASLTGILQTVHGGAAVQITWVTPSDQTVNQTLVVQAAPPQ